MLDIHDCRIEGGVPDFEELFIALADAGVVELANIRVTKTAEGYQIEARNDE